MQSELKRRTACAAGRIRSDATELVLLAEFLRHDSVALLASAIAQRLGASVRDKDLIAEAGLNRGATTADIAAARKERKRR